MNYLTNLVQFPGLGLSFHLNRVAFTIGGVSIYWYGVCIAVGLCLALVFAFRHSLEFGVDPDSMVDVILIGVVLGIISARAYYVAMAPFKYESIWEMIAIRDGGLAIYGGIIGGFLFGGLACKWRKVPMLPKLRKTGCTEQLSLAATLRTLSASAPFSSVMAVPASSSISAVMCGVLAIVSSRVWFS